ncbi:MAG: glutamine synthetase, partial [Paracoccaceae bacterium]
MDLNQFRTFRVATCDLNGQMRGKRLPISDYDTVDTGAIKLPLSALNLDVWGSDIKNSPLVFETGDADGILLPTDRGPVPMPWLDVPTFFVPMWTYEVDRTPFAG